MADVVDKATRSRMMAGIRGTNTEPELNVRKALRKAGYKLRLNDHNLPGSPDVVMPSIGAVVFVHGCFWHRHRGCRFSYTPKTRRKFWLEKFDTNVRRDRRNARRLRRLGWHVLTIWQCGVNERGLGVLLRKLKRF